MDWNVIISFVQPQLFILVVFLYCLGLFLKKVPAFTAEWLIPIDGREVITSPLEKYSEKYITTMLNKIQPGKEYSKKYEKTCRRLLMYLFNDSLFDWEEQYKIDQKICDAICTIDGKHKLWDLLSKEYNARFVIFEYKNYSENISQNEIRCGQKYLNKNQNKPICFIVTPKGADKNAIKEMCSILCNKYLYE